MPVSLPISLFVTSYTSFDILFLSGTTAGFFIIDPEFFGATSTQCLSGVGAAYVFYPDVKLKFLRIEPTTAFF
jgi:hypothetical protein